MQLASTNFDSIVEGIRSVFQPSAVVLYGSHVRGEATEFSDIDILVIRESDFAPGESRSRQLGDLYRAVSKRCDIPKDILLFTKSEFLSWRDTSNHIVAAAWKEGRVLYGEI